DRSIVSNIAGTTRDYVSEVIHLDGTNFKLVDTAGIRDSNDVIENIGIDRAMGILGRAFYKILIVNPFETNAEYLKKFSDIDFDFLVVSHSDKNDFLEQVSSVNFSKIKTNYLAKASFENGGSGSIEPLKIDGPMGPLLISFGSIGPKNNESGSIEPDQKIAGPIEPVSKSGSIGPLKNAAPIEPLDAELGCGALAPGPIEPVLKSNIIKKFEQVTSNNPILLERHRDAVNKIYSEAVSFNNNINGLTDVAILSSEVNILGHSLTELIGIVSPDDVLNSIFANFCIGK
ncbi:MAG: 50S ribosome-binding GTPase, partial [Rhizobacter sp.]|nr:50S ribosome-binding GTPase [Bacteriovorax sp.]